MKKRIILFVVTSAFSTSLAFAQGPASPPTPANPPNPANFVARRVQFLTKQLELTADQQQQATQFFTDEATADTPLLSTVRTTRQSLRTAVQNNDLSTINQLATTIGNLTSQITSNEAVAEAKFYQILTPDQQSKWAASQNRRPGPFGGAPGGLGPNGFRGRR